MAVSVKRSLQGYRIGILKNYEGEAGRYYASSSTASSLPNVFERRRWLQIRRARPSVSLAYKQFDVNTTYTDFKAYWTNEMAFAQSEGKALIIVEAEQGQHVWGDLCKLMEMEDWESGGDMAVRTTTLDALFTAVTTRSLPKDTWGDDIERGECAHIFGKDLFAFAEVDGPQLHAEHASPLVNGFNPANARSIALSDLNRGTLLADEAVANASDDGAAKLCYVVCDGLRDETAYIIDANPLLAELSTTGIAIVPVNSVWLHVCDEKGSKTNPKLYPFLFQPLPWPLHHQSSQGKYILTSGFPAHIAYAIEIWARIVGFSYYEYDATLLCTQVTAQIMICESVDVPGYAHARQMGIPTVSLGWLYSIMENGYKKGSEDQFPVPIMVIVCDLNGTETSIGVEMASPLSDTLETAGIAVSECTLIVDGEEIDDTATPMSLDLHNLCKIEAWPKTLQITLRDAAKNETSFSVRATDPMSTIFDEYASKKEISPKQCTFLLEDGRRIYDHNETPWALGMKSGSTIDVVHTLTDGNWRILPGEREPLLSERDRFALVGGPPA